MRKSIAVALATAVGLIGAGTTAQAAEAGIPSCYYSVRGCVHVDGYYKPSTGTYVRPYVRNYPGYGNRYSPRRYSSPRRYTVPRYSVPRYYSYY